jgi:hypothetical protein
MPQDKPVVKPFMKPVDPQQEAQPFAWQDLTDAQQAAAERIFGLLGGMAGVSSQPDVDLAGPFARFLPVIPEKRTNNVILIDGKRGSGKTSLMAKVLKEVRCALEDPSKGEIGWTGEGQIVPVAFLDLHPLPGSANLLLHLVGTLEEVVCAVEQRPVRDWRGPDEPPWKALATPRPSLARDCWMELNRAAATSWEGNLEQRAANIDPEFYALELGQAERDRRGLAEIFRRFVNALCHEVRVESQSRNGPWDRVRLENGQDPLFLIALDDADLTPERAVDVLNLLRKLWHPRVAFLLTGDSDLFLALLRSRFLGLLLKPVAGIDLPGKQWEIQEVARATTLATETFERIIPPAHRCMLGGLTRERKLHQLRGALEKLEVPDQGRRRAAAGKASAEAAACWPRTLYDYFESEKYASMALPSQIRSLRAVERELEDLGDRGAGASEDGFAPQIAQFIAHLWEGLLGREPLLGEDRDALRQVVRADEAGQLVVEGGALDCRLTARRTRLAIHGNWTLGIMSDHTLSISLPGSALVLSDPLKGAFKVAIDLVADIDSFQFPRGSPTPDGYQFEPVNVKWGRNHDRRMWRGFTWPLPDWEEFLSISQFAAGWEARVVKLFPDRCDSSDLAKMARHFLALVLEVATTRRSAIGAKPPERCWRDLADAVVGLACTSGTGSATERERRNSKWALGRAGLLAAPEGGLPVEHANDWLKELEEAFGRRAAAAGSHLPVCWAEVQEHLAAERHHQVRRRCDGQPTADDIADILRRIDADAPEDHRWRRVVETPIAVPQLSQTSGV